MVIFLIYYYIIYNEILYLFHLKKENSDIHLLKILFFFNFKPFKKKTIIKKLSKIQISHRTKKNKIEFD